MAAMSCSCKGGYFRDHLDPRSLHRMVDDCCSLIVDHCRAASCRRSRAGRFCYPSPPPAPAPRALPLCLNFTQPPFILIGLDPDHSTLPVIQGVSTPLVFPTSAQMVACGHVTDMCTLVIRAPFLYLNMSWSSFFL